MDIFNISQEKLNIEHFQKLFLVILADNGNGISNPKTIECKEETGEVRTKGFILIQESPVRKVPLTSIIS